MSTDNGEQPSHGARPGLQEPPDFASPTESLEALTAEGAPEEAGNFDGSSTDSASPASGVRARLSGLLQGLEPQKALGLALGGGIVIALLLRRLRVRGEAEG